MNCSLVLDELYVVSDLHIGGESGFQIFDSTDEFAWLADHLATTRPNKTLGLMINGDVVDFLAEPSPVYFDALGAAARLDRIFKDNRFSKLLTALKGFVAKSLTQKFFRHNSTLRGAVS